MAIGVWNVCEECGDSLMREEIEAATDLCGFCTEYEITVVYRRRRNDAEEKGKLWRELFG